VKRARDGFGRTQQLPEFSRRWRGERAAFFFFFVFFCDSFSEATPSKVAFRRSPDSWKNLKRRVEEPSRFARAEGRFPRDPTRVRVFGRASRTAARRRASG